ncbi:hypothetical protein [Marivirga sp.]|uniref:hypothetical protein n=1 Tax=Marivirga sp. TaxID=2018662 RepID=UPI0025EE8284|nr:hypothetical protein [Marivirga sp.]
MADKKVSFAVRSIKTDEFATITNSYKEGEDVNIEAGYGFGINSDENTVMVKFSAMFKCQERPFIILKLHCDFDVDPKSFDNFRNIKTNKLVIPKGFLTHLTVLTVGTARGVLHAKLDNTEFDNFILPTLNVSEILKEDLEFVTNEVDENPKTD